MSHVQWLLSFPQEKTFYIPSPRRQAIHRSYRCTQRHCQPPVRHNLLCSRQVTCFLLSEGCFIPLLVHYLLWKMLTFTSQHDCVDAGPMGTRLCLLVCFALLACEASTLQTIKLVLQRSTYRTVYCMHVSSLGSPWMSASFIAFLASPAHCRP